ncbi:MAG: hypothetical protein A2508_00915 [Candidatus Lambdaproteobacteria bacterium RIFOXYD12_FULL_49_8]|uniref:ABC transporter domain-containing protein n=1 Tax=Candidatus Lambdaproteobacteria bacterium RIFOXYD2_FULL_50_16 TaxID=1817772 RepID=A0A1F6GFV4_9PROT|nr:MAG: hypothetical protein A2508_00915 [Candidatus Lambdaproteobacteria bacterium RIFOXYD12_FULL_49_8]OGG96985.1 MAG: hypothetical protein A2527_02705 [Candidatus Lambdaproteobacteria bacterium RIFOXYD2_FULL_50_16]
MIKVEGLSKRFGPLVAVDQISFNLEKGEVLGFLGPNGAGKSTSMRMLTGFLKPDEGQVWIGGINLGEEPKRAKAQIGYLPESAAAYRAMTVVEFLKFIAALRGVPNPQRAVDEVIEKTQLGGVERQTIGHLSKGYRQRVGFAQALVHDPPVLILDEPTDGLDPNQKAEVRKLIKSMAQHKAILLSTHILEEMEAVCSRVLLIAKGKLVANGTPAELLSRSEYHGAIAFNLETALTAAQEAQIAAIAGVKALEGEGTNYRLFAESGASLLGPLHKKLLEIGMEPVELQQLKGKMDEVFRNLTLGEEA